MKLWMCIGLISLLVSGCAMNLIHKEVEEKEDIVEGFKQRVKYYAQESDVLWSDILQSTPMESELTVANQWRQTVKSNVIRVEKTTDLETVIDCFNQSEQSLYKLRKLKMLVVSRYKYQTLVENVANVQ